MKNNILCFFQFIFFHSIISLIKGETIYPYIGNKFSLNNLDNVKIYSFSPRITDLNHEIIVQINSSYYGNGILCTGYFGDKSEKNIYYDSINKELINCQKSFDIKNIEYIEEYNITYDYFNSTFLPEINGYYLIALYIDKNSMREFTGTLTIFDTKMDVIIDNNILNKYIYYKNNYSSKNYSFIIYPNKVNKKYLHIQISSQNNKNIFDINFSNFNCHLIDNKTNISSYNNFIDVSNEEKIYYKLIINFNDNNLNKGKFAIFFEYTSLNNNLMPFPDEIIEINFLTKSNYYFYQNISGKNDKLFYLVYDNSFKRGIATIHSLQISNDELNNINYNIEFEKQINSSVFTTCKTRYMPNFLTAFRCLKNSNLKNESNIMIIKISSSEIYPLKIRNIQFKELKKIIIDENEYKNEIFYNSFNSENLIKNFGYYYIPKSNDIMKRQLVYCSLSNTINIYFGDFDIIEQNLDVAYDKIRLFKLSHNNEDIPGNNFDGFTIITFNKDSNYFIQIIDINKDIYDNFLIEAILERDNINKEIIFDVPIQNYYIFFTNEYIQDYQSMIFDAQILYGCIDIKYIDIDLIPENKFNLKKILLYDEEIYSIKDANHPISIRQTTEFIKITNLKYNVNYYFKAKFYMNKYFIKDNKKFSSLLPIYLNPFETKLFSLDNIYGNIKYFFKLGDNYNDFTSNKDEDLVDIIIGNNNNYHKFNLNNYNNVLKGNQFYVNFGDTIKFRNNFNRSILIWSNLGSLSDQQENIKTLYLSKNFYYLYTFSLAHKLCFDWFNIKKKIKYGLIPQKILISLLNEQQTKTNGYYYQILSFESDNDNITDNNDFLFYYSRMNSINYELEQGESHIFLSEDINITIFDYYYKDKSYINYMIYPLSGLATIFFYVEYLYDLTYYMNSLKFLGFDDSIFSVNLELDNTYIKNKHIYDNYNYIVFQCLSCGNRQPKINFKYNNISYSQENNSNNFIINSISLGNIIGYINMDFFNNNMLNDEIYINIIEPYKIYVKYYYTNYINKNFIYQNNYNINVEKEQNIENNKNIFVVSFDCFLKNIKTNYTILILNKNEIKNEIRNECEFFNYLDNERGNKINKKYFSFIDNNENIRIKKEISFDDYGNYAIYILAHSLDSLSLYKFLGTESYSYTYILNNNTDKKDEKNINHEVIALIIFIVLFIILIVLFIVFRYIRKKKLIKLFNSLNNSFFSEELISSKSTNVKLNNMNEINYIDLTNSINNAEKITNSSENKLELFEKPKTKENNKEEMILENKDKDSENIESELDPELLCRSPAPLLGNTFLSEEDRIRYELAKINQKSYINNNDKDKVYYNTNNGNG